MSKDSVTMAYINLYGILGALEDLCTFSEDAARLATTAKPLSLGLFVRDGPGMVLRFSGGKCRAETAGAGARCDIKIPFGSPEKLNGMVDGIVTPIPTKGWTKLGFLTKNFIGLTKILEDYLRPPPEKLENGDFFAASTKIMFFLIVRAIAQIGNHDKIGSFSASNIADGTIVLSVAGAADNGGPLRAAINIQNHVMQPTREVPEKFQALMEFTSLRLARDLFDGKVSALGCVGQGLIDMKGNLGMLDNINRILDRVAVYLA